MIRLPHKKFLASGSESQLEWDEVVEIQGSIKEKLKDDDAYKRKNGKCNFISTDVKLFSYSNRLCAYKMTNF